MASDSNQDELAARKARNDAIRRERERQNAGTEPTTDEPSSDAGTSGPNYVEFIERKMREGNKPKG